MEAMAQPLHRSMHMAFFIILFKKGLTKIMHQKNPKPPRNTYTPYKE
jgi:hypothetical protein